MRQKRDFSFELRATTFFPQKIQTDKIHHQKARKISYPVVYLANLHYLFPGKAIFGLLSTGLITVNHSVVLPESHLNFNVPVT